jgi:restriction system protein
MRGKLMSEVSVPNFYDMMNPLLQAMRNLGGSGTIEEIYNEVVNIMQLTDEQLAVLSNPEKSTTTTKVEYRLAWTRTYLKKVGLLENSKRGVWALTPEGRSTEWVDEMEVVAYVQSSSKQAREQDVVSEEEGPDGEATWQDKLISIIVHEMNPASFERLFQRILRESGFTQVEVTGRTGDGGIDGTGILRIGGLLSFRVLFQCKKWEGSVGAGVVRDFRGAMVGRADKGLLVTTGNFTKSAVEEATRDGAPAIDLIDGEQLAEKLKELELGVETELVEKVIIDHGWLLSI